MKHVKLFEQFLFEKETGDIKTSLKDLLKLSQDFYTKYWGDKYNPEAAALDFQFKVLKHKGESTDQIEKKIEALKKSKDANQQKIQSAEADQMKKYKKIKLPSSVVNARYRYEVPYGVYDGRPVDATSDLKSVVVHIASLQAQTNVLPEYIKALKGISAKDLTDSAAEELSNKIDIADKRFKIAKSAMAKVTGIFNDAASKIEGASDDGKGAAKKKNKEWSDFTPAEIAKKFMSDYDKSADDEDLDSWLDIFAQDNGIESALSGDLMKKIAAELKAKDYSI